MKARFLILIAIFIMYSCGASKNTYKPKPKKIRKERRIKTVQPYKKKTKKIAVEIIKNEKKPKVPKVKPVIHLNKKPTNHTELTIAYIEKFAAIAVKEMRDYKIPASITLAQGVLESGSGKSPLAIRSNNHFGIKCHKGWKGNSVLHDDDEIGECFRKYKYPENSYEDHSKFLTTRSRYAKLFLLKPNDYKGWAYGLKKAGYATDVRYPQKLISIIERYKLYEYDKLTLQGNKSEEPKPTVEKVIHTVKKGDTLYSISRKYGVSVRQLKKMNGLYSNTLSINQRLVIK